MVAASRGRRNEMRLTGPGPRRVLICDRDRKWSRAVLAFLEKEGVRIIRTPFRAPNCYANAERIVRSIRATAPASTIFATSGSTGMSGPPRLPGMVPVTLTASPMKRTSGALVVIAQQALSVQMIDQGDGSFRIPSLFRTSHPGT
jgi:hypothetical protein